MPTHVKKYFSLKSLALGTLTLSAATLLHAADGAEAGLWSCRAAADGKGWDCGQTSAPAPTRFDKPAEALPAAASAAPLAAAGDQAVPSAPNIDSAAPPELWMNFEAWDWVPTAALGKDQCARDQGLCDGNYIEPPRDWKDSDKAPANLPIDATSSSADLQNDAVNMSGSVTMVQGYRRVRALNADIDRDTNILNLKGGVEIREPNTLIRGQSAAINLNNGLGEVSGASLLNHKSGARVTASSLIRDSATTLKMREASFTQCTPDDDAWSIHADKIELDDETGRGVAKRATLRVADVPVLYSPYLDFPIDDRRMSGFLWPSFGSTDAGGTDIALPYYFNLGPNYDATLTPRIITDRGEMFEAETRYLNQYSKWTVSGAYLSGDKEFADEDRWLFQTTENGSFNANISHSINYSKVSDNDYFSDLDVTSLETRRTTQLTQTGSMGYLDNLFAADIQVLQYQTLADDLRDPYKELPRINWSKRDSGANFAPDFLWQSEFVSFDHDDPASDNNGSTFVTGERVYIEPGVAFPMQWLSAYITPAVKLRHVSYALDRADNDTRTENPSTTSPLASLDMGMFFERELQWNDSTYLQTFEPRLFYLYSDDEDQVDQPLFDTAELTFGYQQLFRDRRFTGYDRLGDFDQMTIGFTSRLLEDASGREKFNVSFGQILYFENPQIELYPSLIPLDEEDEASQSEFAAELNYQIIDGTWATASTLWDNEENLINDASFFLHHQGQNDVVYNLGYNYQRQNPQLLNNQSELRQTDASIAYPINNRWGVFTRWNYDLEQNTSFEELVGIEYRECCWLIRLVYQKAAQDSGELDPLTGIPTTEMDNIVMLEFQLRGLGSLGNRTKSMLSESIWGYRERN